MDVTRHPFGHHPLLHRLWVEECAIDTSTRGPDVSCQPRRRNRFEGFGFALILAPADDPTVADSADHVVPASDDGACPPRPSKVPYRCRTPFVGLEYDLFN